MKSRFREALGGGKRMEMRVFSCSLGNNQGKPNEDNCLVSKRYPIFAVADGVSRDRNPDGSYLEPSGAALAAELFCQEALAYLEKNFRRAGLKTIKEAFFGANFAIRIFNVCQGMLDRLDYLANDYFGTCGVAAFLKGNILYYGYVGDCGLSIYDNNDYLRFVSVDDVAPLEEWREKQPFQSRDEKMVAWRKTLRNMPYADYQTYGVFTGEPEVKRYYHLGKMKLNPGDIVFLYSDGFAPLIKMSEFRQLFRTLQGKELEQDINEFVMEETARDDKSLVVFVFSLNPEGKGGADERKNERKS